MSSRRRLDSVLFTIAAIALSWTLILIVTGGFSFYIGGTEVRAHDVRRPGLLGLIVLIAFVVAHGPRQTWTEAMGRARAFNQWLERVTLPHRVLVLMLALLTFVYAWKGNACVAGGSDSYGYLSQAQLWLKGVPIVEQPVMAEVPWMNGPLSFAPLGYTPAKEGNAIVPTYAAGLPLLLAGIQKVAGYSAIFLTWPVAGMLLVLASYGLGRGLGSASTGLIAAWFMATDITLRSEVTQPMSDVPVAAALAVACYFLFRSSGSGLTPALPPVAPIRAGIAATIAVLVRPNLVPSVAVLGLWLALQPLFGARVSWREALRRAALFGLAAAPGALIIAFANRALYGSPLLSGYGDVAHIFSIRNFVPNLRAYAGLIVDTRAEMIFAGLIACWIPLRRLWPAVHDRSVFVGIGLFVFTVIAEYMLFEPATNPGYVRYLLPASPLLLAGAARVALLAARPGWRAALVSIAIVLLGVRSELASHPPDAFFPNGRGERVYSQTPLILREHAAPNSVVLAMQHSGSVRYYAGLMTVRWDWIEPDWLDRAVEWFERRGVHVYAELEPWEVPIVRKRFAGQSRAGAFASAAFRYEGELVTEIFDISSPAAERTDTVTVKDDFAHRITPPAPMSPLRLETIR